MRKNSKKLLAWGLSLAMISSVLSIPGTAGAAKKKQPCLNYKKITLKVGQSKKIKVKSAPKGAKITWSSAKKKIARVSRSGKITGISAGKTKITAKLAYSVKKKKNTKKLTLSVTVKKAVSPLKTTAPAAISSTTTPAAVSSTTAPATAVSTAAVTAITATPATLPPVSTASSAPTAFPEEISNLGTKHKSANGLSTKDNGMMRKDFTSLELMDKMGLGWNYGNSLEAILSKDDITPETTVHDFECAWGNIPLTQKNVDALKKYGFNNIRIPVAWSNMISDDGKYTINEQYLNRVEEVLNYALNDEMYVIINIHWDSDWWGQFGDADQTVRNQAWARYRSFWTQIANRYKEYSDRLIFESANEELGDRLNDDWRNMSAYPKTGTLSVDEQYQTMNQINQEFVNIVRSSGGNNISRQLLIAGYSTNISCTSDPRFQMPADTVENGQKHLSVSVHYYNPWNYCGGNENLSADSRNTWGTEDDVRIMHNQLDLINQSFIKRGYGVILGEFGVQSSTVDNVTDFFNEFITYSQSLHMVPVLWDNGAWFDRRENCIKYDNIGNLILKLTGSTETFPSTCKNTGIPTDSENK